MLYDLYASTEPALEQSDDKDTRYPCRKTLPWKLTLHFQDWPDQELVGLDEQGRVMHDFFMNSVKEADFVRNGTGKSIMTLSKEDSNKLWTSIQERMCTTCLFLVSQHDKSLTRSRLLSNLSPS